MQNLFSASFSKSTEPLPAGYQEIPEKSGYIDGLIEKSAPQFPISKIAKIDVAILRLAVFELCINKKEPPKVIIDEAVELAKEYGSSSSPPFINGVLGTIYNNLYGKKS